jgi:hypothetical protein
MCSVLFGLAQDNFGSIKKNWFVLEFPKMQKQFAHIVDRQIKSINIHP